MAIRNSNVKGKLVQEAVAVAITESRMQNGAPILFVFCAPDSTAFPGAQVPVDTKGDHFSDTLKVPVCKSKTVTWVEIIQKSTVDDIRSAGVTNIYLLTISLPTP